MKTLSYFLGFLGLLLGAFYGFASSPNYVKVLTYSVICEVVSIVAFAYLFFKSNGYLRLLPMVGGLLAVLVLIQSAIRLIRILSS